jgi:hypothetical protein
VVVAEGETIKMAETINQETNAPVVPPVGGEDVEEQKKVRRQPPIRKTPIAKIPSSLTDQPKKDLRGAAGTSAMIHQLIPIQMTVSKASTTRLSSKR